MKQKQQDSVLKWVIFKLRLIKRAQNNKVVKFIRLLNPHQKSNNLYNKFVKT